MPLWHKSQVRKQDSTIITAWFPLFLWWTCSPSMLELQRWQAGAVLELPSPADAAISHLWFLMNLLPGEALFMLFFCSCSCWRLLVASLLTYCGCGYRHMDEYLEVCYVIIIYIPMFWPLLKHQPIAMNVSRSLRDMYSFIPCINR